MWIIFKDYLLACPLLLSFLPATACLMNGGEGEAVWTRISISPLTIGLLYSLGMYSCIPKTSFLLKLVGT